MRYLILLLSFNVMAGNYDNDVINNYYVAPEVNYIGDSNASKGVALALATWHPFTYNSEKWQGSINGAAYDGESALSMGLAKKFNGIDALFHSSYGQNNGKDALTFGMLWRF
jgi:hypothetical protein